MSDTILGGDITVYYLDEVRQKRLEWTGSAIGTRTMNEVYSAMATLLDEAATGDDATCMFADTPVEYTVGIIDANDKDPWYISYECVQHLTGGSLRTAGWTHTDGTDTGIVVVPVTSNTITGASLGLNIQTDTDTDSGTLLEIIEQGATDYLVIRPDDNTAGNSFDNTPTVGGGMTCNAQTATQAAAANTGEQIWANLYNVTPIESDTHVYMYQGTVSDAARARIADINDGTQDWWPEGAFDRCIFIQDYKTAAFDLIDAGYITCFARKGNTLYDSFEVLASTTSGGRNPVPLSAASDGNNTVGDKSVTCTAASGNWTVGDEMQGDTSGARGIVTQIDNPGATQTLHYYLIGDPQTDFQTAAEGLTNNDDTGTGTKNGSAPAAQGPALSTWFTNNAAPSVTHANTTADVDDDGTTEGYGVTLNCNSNPLTEVYPWLQYVTRNGETATTDSDGIEGEQYVGATVFLSYTGTVTGTITEGNDVTQETSGATGIVISHDTTKKQILLRDTRGTFATHATTHTLTDNDSSGTVEIDGVANNFAAAKANPFGSFAGGRFFGARGVVLTNTVGTDENSYEVITSDGVKKQRPIAINLSVSNLEGGAETASDSDLVWMHRLTGAGGAIDKTEYSAAGGEAIGDTTLVVDGSIAVDVPGKTGGGVLNIRDASDNNKHYRLRYSSWTGSTFTLANIDVVDIEATSTTTKIDKTGAFTNAKRGDLVLNKTQGNAISYVTEVTSANSILISPAITGQTNLDDIELNAIPVTMNTADDVYVSLIDRYATGANETVSIVYSAPIFFRVKVSNTRNATKIRRFVTDDTTSGSDRNTATIRNADPIIT